MTNSIAELEDAPVILLVGSNTAVSHPVIALRIKKAVRRGAKLIVVDPRRTEMTDLATLWLRLQVGTDIALMNALAQVIIQEGLHDREFIAQAVDGFDEFARSVQEYTPEHAAAITGVSAADIRAAARLYAGAPKAAIVYCLGVTEHACGTHNVLSVTNLALLAGNLGVEAGGVNPLRGQNNVQGAGDMGALPNVLPGYQKIIDPAVREKFERAWGVSLPAQPGLNKNDLFRGVLEGKVRGLYVHGYNVVRSDANANYSKEVLKNVEFLVVQDIFPNETTEYAHVVLPAAAWGETEGTYTNSERRVQRVRRAVEPPGEAKQDWEIFQEIARRLGRDFGWRSSEDIWNELRSLAPTMAGISYRRIEDTGLQWPCPDEDHPGTRFLHAGMHEGRQRGRLTMVEHQPPMEQPDEDYPLLLTTGRRLYHYHTATQTRRARGIEQILGRERVDVSPQDAAELGLVDEDWVRLTSRRGEVECAVRVTDDVPKGTVFLTFHFAEVLTNDLTNDAEDPLAGTAEFKACAVRLVKLGRKAAGGMT